jgi:hypothetical protein
VEEEEEEADEMEEDSELPPLSTGICRVKWVCVHEGKILTISQYIHFANRTWCLTGVSTSSGCCTATF